ncbi:E set [Glarea lozoyensis ATCC 20868]|uniref:E set n=1 Tax=Glarea lozoyensis (strain ATCC 20868 / MF5171) TaxID=1116229 RepID=S3D6P7_GLAL2|nr:E set [Glarea lozoyensis ATCC 20868]EPE27701.1 E set [Glarea lozoyensis ATCC 20868]
MCAYATPASSTSTPVVSTRRSLLARLTSPLKSRTRNLTDFHIRADEPHRQYSPGDVVTGAVVLTIVKPVRITHITVRLHGTVRVFKNPNDANEPVVVDAELAAAGDPRKTQYFGNGHASLFNDEVTLCGEGRLETGIYEFKFELEFPRKGLPTSIDFERGTISYLITATVTRPTSIAATSSCDQKINLVETVDIGPMMAPKPRTISLEPIARRPRRRKTVKAKEGSPQEVTDPSSSSEQARTASSPRPEESASQCGSTDHTANPRSPASSEVQSVHSAATSADSAVSSSTGLSFQLGPVPPSARSAKGSQTTNSKVSIAEKTITATIECLKAGCLPGDNIPLKISIKHCKAMKSMHGVIITLYRQGRIDSAPPLSLFKDIKGKQAERLKHEEYYPKSKTGLGGLSLTSAGSSSVFRKDLAQTFAPIFVDPVSLSTVINASVRVPEDAFTTITGVPGQMITFKYLIEVVVDLGGKLAGLQRHAPRAGAVATYAGNSTGPRGDANMLAAWGSNIVDTDHIRREKSVVSCLFEVVVGSTDSARKRGRGNSSAQRTVNEWNVESPKSPTRVDPIYEESAGPHGPVEGHQNNQEPYPYHEHPYDEEFPDYYANPEYDYNHHPHYPHEPPAHSQIHVPPPEIQNEEGLSEKERARRAEQRLLPSQPPAETTNEESSSSRTINGPSAPSAPPSHPLDSVDDIYDAEPQLPNSAPSAPPPHDLLPSAPPPVLAPSAPPPEDLTQLTPSHPTDDKQELERQRLLIEASAPADHVPDDDNAGEGSSSLPHEPSAPVLGEVDGDGDRFGGVNGFAVGDGAGARGGEMLPRYER